MLKFCSVYLPMWLLAGAMALCAQDGASKSNSLTEEQKQTLQQRVQTLESDAKAQVDKQNAKIAEIAKNIDRNLLSGNPSEELDRKLSADFATEVTNLVNATIQAKLAAVREMVKVLTPEQKAVLMAALDKPGANPDLAELVKVLK
jgi:Spy/CpxP family protein refolding chaperone